MVISWIDNGQILSSCKPFTRQVDTAVNGKMFGMKLGPRIMTLEKSLVGSFSLQRGRSGEKALNRELPSKSGDITCVIT